MDFVENNRRRVLRDEKLRIYSGIAHIDDRIEDYMWHLLAEQIPEQRAFTYLPRSRNQNRRESRGISLDFRFEMAISIIHP